MPLYCFCLTDTRVLASHCTLAQFSLAAVDCLEYFLCSTVKFRHYLCEPLLCQTPMSKLASWKVSLLNHRMVKVGRDLWFHLFQPPWSSRDTQSRLPRTMSRQLLMIFKKRDSITSLSNLWQYFRQNLLCSNLCPLSLVLVLGATENSMPLSALHSSSKYICW